LSAYVAYVHDHPASGGLDAFPCGRFATLFAGSTPRSIAGRAYIPACWRHLKEIRERGYLFAAVEAGAMSRPIVARHGFQHLTTVWDYRWKGAWQQLEATDCNEKAEIVLSA
jgi:hypothetical protein